MFTPLESLVLATVAYTAQFDYPLSRVEIYQRCLSVFALKTIGVRLTKIFDPDFSKLTFKKLNQVISKLEDKKILKVEQKNQKRSSAKKQLINRWLSLASSQENPKISLVSQRFAREKIAAARLKDWQKLQDLLNSIPWVFAAAVTGSAAMANGSKKSDLDVMIVAMPGRLWLARIWVLMLAWWHQRRHASGWCFNLWLEPSELGLPPQRQGVYEAYELWQCYWLVDKAGWRYAWLDKNAWFQNFLPFASLEPRFFKLVKPIITTNEFFPDWLMKIANSLAYLIQVHYRRWRHGEPLAPRSQAFLHAPDSRSEIYARWQQQLEILGLIKNYVRT